MLKDFKAFIMRGNVLDLAVAVIIGAAFGKVITSLVNDIILPPIGFLLGKVDFSNLYINLSGTAFSSLAEAQKAGAPTINYGVFINAILNFMIVALVVFLIVKLANRLQSTKTAPPPPTTKDCPYCFSSIAIAATRCPNCTSQLP